MTRKQENSNDSGNGNGSRITIQLLFWVLGALLALVGTFSGIAHSMMMRQLDTIEQRINMVDHRVERVEDKQERDLPTEFQRQ